MYIPPGHSERDLKIKIIIPLGMVMNMGGLQELENICNKYSYFVM